MAEYIAPIRDMKFVLNELVGLEKISTLPGCEDATSDLVDQILEEAGRFASEVLAPLNQSGDKEGSSFESGAESIHFTAGGVGWYGWSMAHMTLSRPILSME